MPHFPPQLPRTSLNFTRTLSSGLAPKKKRAHDSQRNPLIDNSGVRQVIEESGKAPGGLRHGGVTFGLIYTGITGFIFLTSLPAMGSTIKEVLRPSPDGENMAWFLLIYPGVPLVLFSIGIIILSYSVVGARRYRTAWNNGWIEYRPALIGELTFQRSRTTGDENKKTYYYYTAPLLVLQPNGTFNEALSREFTTSSPNWLKSRGAALTDGTRPGIVDFQHNNGWTVVAYRTDVEYLDPELHNGLSDEQKEAVLNFTEQHWVR